mgnify:FL=1|tara:strand:+ start:2886 stop:3920 length:1035 start_codon:yes stop_codon:yes gene_type:complete
MAVYTTIDKPTDYFNIKLYTGTGSSNSITGIGFAPDWVWIRNRAASHHMIFDKVRGAGKVMYTNLTDAETTVSGHLTSFDSDGFTLGDNSGKGSSNGNTESYVAWNWLAGGSGSSNTDGDQTTTVSASTTAGFSICTFTEAGSAPYSFGHGLGVEPDVVWFKSRGATGSWQVYFKALGSPSGKLLQVNSTNAVNTSSTWWGTINSSIVTINAGLITPNTTALAYCFAEKQGYSKFGTYTGNGNADGTFVYLGFKPAFVIIKDTSSTDPWHMIDNKRSPINLVNARLFPNNNNSENTSADICDFVSNGIKFKGTNDGFNGSRNYMYMAFAESPFVNSKKVPNNAR